jgi:hypothetical protein
VAHFAAIPGPNEYLQPSPYLGSLRPWAQENFAPPPRGGGGGGGGGGASGGGVGARGAPGGGGASPKFAWAQGRNIPKYGSAKYSVYLTLRETFHNTP